jgi:hypothetical protein
VHSPGRCRISDQTIGTQRSQAHTGAVTLIQRFGSAANLNLHRHCLALDGCVGATISRGTLSPVPEPGTYAPMPVGLGLLGIACRRKTAV